MLEERKGGAQGTSRDIWEELAKGEKFKLEHQRSRCAD